MSLLDKLNSIGIGELVIMALIICFISTLIGFIWQKMVEKAQKYD